MTKQSVAGRLSSLLTYGAWAIIITAVVFTWTKGKSEGPTGETSSEAPTLHAEVAASTPSRNVRNNEPWIAADTIRIVWVFSGIHATGYFCAVIIAAFANWCINSASDAPRQNYEWLRGGVFVRKATDREVTVLDWKGVPDQFYGVWVIAACLVALAGLFIFGFWRGLFLLGAVLADAGLVYGAWLGDSERYKPTYSTVFGEVGRDRSSFRIELNYRFFLFVSFLVSVALFYFLLATPSVQLTLTNGPWSD